MVKALFNKPQSPWVLRHMLYCMAKITSYSIKYRYHDMNVVFQKNIIIVLSFYHLVYLPLLVLQAFFSEYEKDCKQTTSVQTPQSAKNNIQGIAHVNCCGISASLLTKPANPK